MANENIPNEMGQDEILASILQKMSQPPTGTAPPNSSGDGQPHDGVQNPMGDVISSLLSNPDMLAKLPSILSSIKPIIDMLGGIGASPSASTTTPASTVQASPISVNAINNKSTDSRTALLCAMKPYLSHDRQNAIDYIVKLGHLGDILKTL